MGNSLVSEGRSEEGMANALVKSIHMHAYTLHTTVQISVAETQRAAQEDNVAFGLCLD